MHWLGCAWQEEKVSEETLNMQQQVHLYQALGEKTCFQPNPSAFLIV